jgi:hypothetical protein
MCVATIFGIGVGVSAQSDSMAKDQMGKKDMKNPVTVSGCLTAGMDAGKYMLTNAMTMKPGMMKKDSMGKEMDHDKMKPGMAEDHMMMSYELVGGSDLQAHVGHKMEVTGSLSKSDMDHMAKMNKTEKMDKMEKDKMMANKDMKPIKLNVTSVKMVSANCS